MERAYAGILGLVAFSTATLQGFVRGSAVEASLLRAWQCMLTFTVLGFVIALLAGWLTDEAVRSRVATEMAERQTAKPASATKNLKAVTQQT